jgi:hypothetical protein
MTHAVGSNRPYAFPTSAPEGGEVATKITITPDSNSPPGATGFFGDDGLSFADVLDAINPLKHIPIVSDLIYDKPEEKASVASNLVGGALMGGPIGFVASIANEVFKSATGKGMAETVVAALSGEIASEPETQLAAATPMPADAGQEKIEVASLDVENIPAPSTSAAQIDRAVRASQSLHANDIAQRAQLGMISSAATDAPKTDDARAQKLLELFGGSTPSANRAYKNAQMLPYLKQASTNQVL